MEQPTQTVRVVEEAEPINAAAADLVMRPGKFHRKVFAGGWLILKPPYGVDDYAYTSSNDEEWFKRKGFRPIMQCRLRGHEHDLENVLRAAADQAKGLKPEERAHCKAAADQWAANKAARVAEAAKVPETSEERVARLLSENLPAGIAKAIETALEAKAEEAETTDEQPKRGRNK